MALILNCSLTISTNTTVENKSLNVFNTSCVLADPITTSDANYLRIEGIIGHEYFHNWTGNRVTCRDWFQLTLKEGLTVFRDQQFSGMINNCASVQRIQNVLYVRGVRWCFYACAYDIHKLTS